jgi:hypothetical protein
MPGTWLHRLTTVYLAALYGVVGLTGDSLHYLATNLTEIWTESDPVETVVYYHVHGPDFYGHFHKHTAHVHHAPATNAHRPARQSKPYIAVTSEQSTHQPHACPLLRLVSTLKLVQACALAPSHLRDSIVTNSCQSDAFFAPQVVLDSYARGPPRVFFA